MEIKNKSNKREKARSKCSDITVIAASSVSAAICFLIGFFLYKYELTQVILDNRLKMQEFMPHYKWWQNTSSVLVTCKIYVFSVTNAQRWLDNLDDQLHFEETGPITYRESLDHLDVVFHPHNSTMSYNSKRQLSFMPDRNEKGILNKTITIPNTAVLAMAAKLENSSFILKWGFKWMMSRSGDEVFMNTTVYNYLWNLTSPIMKTAKSTVPFMVPIENIGVLSVMYHDYNDRVNVRHGKQHGNDQFFMINTYKHRPTVPGFKPEEGDCFASVVNSSEGASYQQNLNEDSVLIFWRKTLCRAVPLYFEKKVHRGPLIGYKYVLPDSSYDRLQNATEDCYKGQIGWLEDGMTDMSKCLLDFPVAATSPHYYARNMSMAKKITGMKPDREKHYSYIIADPSFGIPIDQCARTQSNLVIPKLSGYFDEIVKFSEHILPMFWIEYHQSELPPHIVNALQTFYVIKGIQPYLPYIFYTMFLLLLVVALCRARRYDCDKEEIQQVPLLNDHIDKALRTNNSKNNNNNNGYNYDNLLNKNINNTPEAIKK